MTLDTQPELVARLRDGAPRVAGIRGYKQYADDMWKAADALERALPISCEDGLEALKSISALVSDAFDGTLGAAQALDEQAKAAA